MALNPSVLPSTNRLQTDFGLWSALPSEALRSGLADEFTSSSENESRRAGWSISPLRGHGTLISSNPVFGSCDQFVSDGWTRRRELVARCNNSGISLPFRSISRAKTFRHTGQHRTDYCILSHFSADWTTGSFSLETPVLL